MAHLEIRLLGSLEVILDGQPLRGVTSDRELALLAYLAVESHRPHRREKLAGLLWPEVPEELARAKLRRALCNLRTALHDHDLPHPVFDASTKTIQLDRGADVWVDVLALRQHIAESGALPRRAASPGGGPGATGRGSSSTVRCLSSGDPSTIGHLQSAVELYCAPFLEGFSLAHSAAFEEWALLEQEHLHRLVLEALHCLTEQLEAQGEPEQALRHAWRQVELDPWRESGYRQVMRLLAGTGQRAAALAQYEVCRRRLATDLGAEPSVETTALYERIRDQADGQRRRAALPPAERADPEGEEPAAAVLAAAQPAPQPAAAGHRRLRRAELAAGALTLIAAVALLAVWGARSWAPRGPVTPPDPGTARAGQADPAQPPTAASVTASLLLTDALPLRIVYASTEAPSAQGEIGHIYVMDRDGGQRQLLPGSEEGVEESRPLWLPGRQGIVYERVARTGNAKSFSLWLMSPDGSGRQPLLGGSDARTAALSPDGRRIAFLSRRGSGYQLFHADLDGSDVVQVTQEDGGIRRPSWSPDGAQLAFDAGDVASSSIYVAGLDGSGLTRLTTGTQDNDPAWSPDGRSIAFVSLRDGNAEVYVMDSDGSGQVNVSNQPQAEDRDVSWTPDQRLIFASDRDGDWEIYVMNRNGSHLVKLTDNSVDDRWPNWR